MLYALTLHTRLRRLVVFALFYFSEGLPVGFTTIALAAYLRGQGVNMTTVGTVVAATYTPWVFKWAWAPLVDLIRVQRFGPGGTWILACQSGMILTLASMLAFDALSNLGLVTALVLLHNILAATHDVAIDGMAVRVIPANEMGTANGWMFAAQFAGIAIGGSGALYVSSWWGFRASLVFLLLSLLCLLLLVTLPLREPPDEAVPAPREGSLLSAILERVRGFFRELYVGFFRSGSAPLVGALFAAFPHGAMGLGLALSPGLQVDMKLSEQMIGNVSFLSNIGGAFGSLLGGWLSDRTGSARLWIAVSYIATPLITLGVALQLTGTGAAGLSVTVFALAVTAYSLFYGIYQGAGSGMFMQLSSKAVAATQFTAFMALSNLSSSYSSLWQGRSVDQSGYAATLKLDAALGFTGLLVLYWLRPKRQAE